MTSMDGTACLLVRAAEPQRRDVSRVRAVIRARPALCLHFYGTCPPRETAAKPPAAARLGSVAREIAAFVYSHYKPSTSKPARSFVSQPTHRAHGYKMIACPY